MQRPAWVRLTVLLLVSGISSAHAAASPEICYSAESPSPAPVPTNDTTFNCPESGVLTIRTIAAAGYRIVSLKPISGSALGSVRQQLVVQRDQRIFANGFEAH